MAFFSMNELCTRPPGSYNTAIPDDAKTKTLWSALLISDTGRLEEHHKYDLHRYAAAVVAVVVAAAAAAVCGSTRGARRSVCARWDQGGRVRRVCGRASAHRFR